MNIDEKIEILNNYCKGVKDCETDACILWKDSRCVQDFVDARYKSSESAFETNINNQIELLKDAGISLSELKKENVNHPSHYETGKFECIEVMQEVLGADTVKDFCIANAFKYLYRHKNKNGIEDVKKAKWYIDKFLELEN